LRKHSKANSYNNNGIERDAVIAAFSFPLFSSHRRPSCPALLHISFGTLQQFLFAIPVVLSVYNALKDEIGGLETLGQDYFLN
jgi:ABC-type Co2+ transport system permease subunit